MTRKIFCSRTLAIAMQFGILASYLQWLETCAKIMSLSVSLVLHMQSLIYIMDMTINTQYWYCLFSCKHNIIDYMCAGEERIQITAH